MTNVTAENTHFAAELARAETTAGTSGPLWLRRLQKSALGRFRSLGLPTTRDEEWRQTNVSPIASTPFRRVEDPVRLARRDLPSVPFADLDCPRLVFVDGRFAPDLSSTEGLPANVQAGSLAVALRDRPEQLESHLARHAAWENRAFVALNTALFEDGALVVVPDGCLPEAPLHLLHVGSRLDAPARAYPRTLVVVGAHSRLVVVETYVAVGEVPYFTDAVSEVVLGENASVVHCRVQRDGARSYHVASLHSRQAGNSRFLSLNVSLGSALTRNDVGSVLDGEGAEATLNGLYLADGKQHVDNHTTIDHARPHCSSHELYKGVLAGSARAVFNGRIIVRPDAQKTDAKQSNRNLLLSDDAVVHTRPQLEIHANDVKCTHGATIGHLDEDALFYLRTRGIGRREARAVLIRAFTSRVLRDLSIAPLRDAVEKDVAARLEGVGEEGERA